MRVHVEIRLHGPTLTFRRKKSGETAALLVAFCDPRLERIGSASSSVRASSVFFRL